MNVESLQQTTMFDSFPCAVYMCDSEGQVTYFNQQAVALWGRTPRLKDPSELFCPFCKAYTLEGQYISPDEGLMAQALTTGRVIQNATAVLERPDGSKIIAQFNVSPVRNE